MSAVQPAASMSRAMHTLARPRQQRCIRDWVSVHSALSLRNRALRRKVGGTAKDYWKDWVETQGDYTDKGYVSRQNATVPGVSASMAMVSAELLIYCIITQSQHSQYV